MDNKGKVALVSAFAFVALVIIGSVLGVSNQKEQVQQTAAYRSCVDSDGGITNTTNGTVTYNGRLGTKVFTDSCSGDILTEYYCQGNIPQYVEIDCNPQVNSTNETFMCVSGACVW